MKIYKVKLQRTVIEEVEVLVEAEHALDIMHMDAETRDKLVTHADNTGSWDGDLVGRERIKEFIHVKDDEATGRLVFKVNKE